MPADGVISQLGKIEEDKILQAKGHNYSLEALLAGNYLMADLFRNGTFVTTYLSPRDYHRVHMPCNGILREMIYVRAISSPLTISRLRTCRICLPVTNA